VLCVQKSPQAHQAGTRRPILSPRAGVLPHYQAVQAGTLSLLNDPYLPSGTGVLLFSTPPLGTARLLNIFEDLKALLSPFTTDGVIKC
jgi:hypothetical protein